MKKKTLKPQRRKGQLKERFESMTDDMVAQKWLALRPQLLRGLALFVSLAIVGFLARTYLGLSEDLSRYVALGAYFCLTLSACVLFMTIMTYVFGRPPKQA